MTNRKCICLPVAAETAKTSATPNPEAATPTPATPFADFPGLVRHLPMYGERTLRSLVKKKVIPSIRPPRTRKLAFHLPSVEVALLRYQLGGIE